MFIENKQIVSLHNYNPTHTRGLLFVISFLMTHHDVTF